MRINCRIRRGAIVALLFVMTGNPRAVRANSCAWKKIALATAGLAVLPESAIIHWGKIGATGRSPFFYLAALRLWGYDLRGKKILDVGSGRSRFAQFVNGIYGSTGTIAVPIDLGVSPRGPHATRADGSLLPFANGSFDLTTNYLMYPWLAGTPAGWATLEEMLRVTRPGGEVRLAVNVSFPTDVEEEYLRRHPAVEKVTRYGFSLPSTQSTLEIKLKAEVPNDAELQAFFTAWERERGLAPWRPELIPISPFTHPEDAGARDAFLVSMERRFYRRLPIPTEALANAIPFFTPPEELKRAMRLILLGDAPDVMAERVRTLWDSFDDHQRSMLMQAWEHDEAASQALVASGIYKLLAGRRAEKFRHAVAERERARMEALRSLGMMGGF